MIRSNLFRDLPADLSEERCDALVESDEVRIERIVSHGQRSPEGFWYNQEREEWVALLAGRARLEVEGEPRALELEPGDWVRLPAHCRHRVSWTDPDGPTVWLAVYYASD